ncbi:MAG: NADH-quinone oxidoreductase subunit J [Clostridiaceae bacterium BRH_c20a]|nr:MAG: NADH-quinone oxidoreductase subunit J [Clostridiaceae bacterium BRH_c20a]
MDSFITGSLIYWLVAALFLLGVYGILANNNLMKKLMAMNIMQVAVIVFFLILGQKLGGTLPILMGSDTTVDHYINPLPHALMLTAIVVSLSTTGVALALLMRIQERYGEIEEDDILRRMNE